jgi:hypothetical protein
VLIEHGLVRPFRVSVRRLWPDDGAGHRTGRQGKAECRWSGWVIGYYYWDALDEQSPHGLEERFEQVSAACGLEM